MLRILPIWIALLTCSCSEKVIESEQSLVGAKRLPAADVLTRETLIIRDNTNEAHAYQYELAPTGSLSITRYDLDKNGLLQKFASKQTFRITSREDAIARKLLSRLRPEELEGMGVSVPPQGCTQQKLHASGDYAVVFISPGTKKGAQDDQIGIFLSGYPKTCAIEACCTAPAALAAHTVVRQAIQQLVKGAK